MVRKLFPLILIGLLTTACHTQKDLGYFDNIQDSSAGTIAVADYGIKIVPEDELLITVTSEIQEATKQFNQNMFNPISRNDLQEMAGTTQSIASKANTSGSSRLPTYMVNREGNIDFPILGTIHVEGMTTAELAAFIRERVSRTVKDPQVKVTLLNFKVNVLGEVQSPHTINVTTEKFSIIDALAACGDLTEYGKRDNIIIIREQNDGTRSYQRVNLHDTNLFSSPYFYLKQNDIVYVEPNNIKQDNSKYNQNNGYKLSVTSTIVSMASVIASLIIALTIK
ncbi:polysaccharide biosynthesis/export family protein [uncultured Muribaculum sp.]|uniref:polysaccharide biosynthesis/export family protein n=1 Tax=uncultured Muribaculum sp. TaxID=1918613 RepID=UPI0026012ECC|nr:polysaccharide biosynthesis/export family protein [uncultured Muribaculum sp.]